MNNPLDAFSTLPAPQNVRTYRRAFVTKCHQLLLLGYRRMNHGSFGASEETVITGELVKEIEAVLESPSAPKWAASFEVHDDPPQNAPGRRGKSRRRIDIAFVQVRHGPRPRFRFEAKRLHDRRSIAAYVGKDGLTLFTTGEYASEDPDAGMLGYVQSGTLELWAAELDKILAKYKSKYRLTNEGLVAQAVVAGLVCFTSIHDRSQFGSIEILHTFLRFH